MRFPKSKAVYVSAAAVFALLSGSAAAGTAAYKTVTVSDNGQRRVIRGFAFGSVGSFLRQHHIRFSRRDRVHPQPSDPVRDGMHIVIEHPVEVEVVDQAALPGTKPVHRRWITFARTVGQLLRQQRVTLGPRDRLEPGLDTKLHPGEVVHIRRQLTRIATRTEDIPFQTVRRRTDSLYIGQQRVLTYGVKGLRRIQTTMVFVGGHQVRQQVRSTVVRAPVEEVIEVGSKPRPAPKPPAPALTPVTWNGHLSGRSGGPASFVRSLTVVATAYAAGGRTATGGVAQPGVVAVDPSVIPLGTKLYIPGYGLAVAADTGGSIRGSRIDICLASEAEARSWGVRTVTVYVVK
ncbi:MAG: G5 domain-containing protein [Alicyclobacillus sp.]|nr:G5 domain-containing protein [Alicyclobacillus sp.]